jgi:hypothetical protein
MFGIELIYKADLKQIDAPMGAQMKVVTQVLRCGNGSAGRDGSRSRTLA